MSAWDYVVTELSTLDSLYRFCSLLAQELKFVPLGWGDVAALIACSVIPADRLSGSFV